MMTPNYPGYCVKYETYYEDIFFDEGAFWKDPKLLGEKDGATKALPTLKQMTPNMVLAT